MKPNWAASCSSSQASSPAWVSRAAKSRSSKRKASVALDEAADDPNPADRTWSSLPSLRRMLKGLPCWWLAIVCTAAATVGPSAPLLHGLEVFSGEGHLSAACKKIVGPWSTFERNDNDSEDIMREEGVLILLGRLLRVRRGGIVWLGTPCQSWIALSRSFSMRTSLSPQGPIDALCTPKQLSYLKEHNAMGYISSLILRTAFMLGIHFCLEKPVSSLLFKFAPMKDALQETGAASYHFHMESLNGESPKPLRVLGTAPCLKTFIEVTQIRQKLCKKPAAQRLVKRDAAGGYTGVAKHLKQSSAYTPCMGVAFALAFKGLSAASIVECLTSKGF